MVCACALSAFLAKHAIITTIRSCLVVHAFHITHMNSMASPASDDDNREVEDYIYGDLKAIAENAATDRVNTTVQLGMSLLCIYLFSFILCF